METFGAHIKRLRIAAGQKQASVASHLGKTIQTISEWENNRRAPNSESDVKDLVSFLNKYSVGGEAIDGGLVLQLYNQIKKRGGRPSNREKYYQKYCYERSTFEKFIASSGYYDSLFSDSGFVRGFRLLSKSDWIPAHPVSMSEVNISLSDELEDVVRPIFDPPQYKHISDYKKANGERISDDRIYRLVGLSLVNREVVFDFQETRYDTSIDFQEMTAFETVQWYFENDRRRPSSIGTDLPTRGPAEDVLNLRGRVCAVSTNSITIIKNDPRGGNRFLLHHRGNPQLAEAKNTTHVVPAGTFEPLGLMDFETDFSLEKNILREFGEELLGKRELQGQKYDPIWENHKNWLRGCLESGVINIYYLGFGFDFLTLKGGVLSAIVIDWSELRKTFQGRFKNNWEGKRVRHKLTVENLTTAANDPRTLSFGAACLSQAAKHLDALL